MNQPAEDRIKRLEEEQRQLKEEVRQLREQQTEPIRIGHLEIEQKDLQMTLDNHTAMLQEISTKQDEHGRQLELLVHQSISMASNVEKRFDAIAAVQQLILERLPER
jgi:hypothetical protein